MSEFLIYVTTETVNVRQSETRRVRPQQLERKEGARDSVPQIGQSDVEVVVITDQGHS